MTVAVSPADLAAPSVHRGAIKRARVWEVRVDPQSRASEISGPTFLFAFRAGDGAITQNTAGQRPVITRSACGGAAGSERPARF